MNEKINFESRIPYYIQLIDILKDKVQSLLQSAGFRAVTANGHYDEPTLTSVREFQKSRTGKETGIVDPLTLLQLYRSGNDRAVPSLTGSGKGGGA